MERVKVPKSLKLKQPAIEVHTGNYPNYDAVEHGRMLIGQRKRGVAKLLFNCSVVCTGSFSMLYTRTGNYLLTIDLRSTCLPTCLPTLWSTLTFLSLYLELVSSLMQAHDMNVVLLPPPMTYIIT